jgi:transcription elongation factor Elf1
MENKLPELLPCPFCGCKKIKKEFRYKEITIKCANCTAKFVQRTRFHDMDWLERAVIELWNNRTSEVN